MSSENRNEINETAAAEGMETRMAVLEEQEMKEEAVAEIETAENGKDEPSSNPEEQPEKKEIKIKRYEGATLIENAASIDDELEEYERLRDSREIIHIQFVGIDRKSRLFTNNNGIKIIMPSMNLDGFAHSPNQKESLKKYLCGQCPVIVQHVSRKNREVIVSMNDAMEEPRNELIQEIEKGIEEKVYVRVPAVVVSISGRKKSSSERDYSIVMVNIGGLGISGYVHKSQWSKCFTKSFKNIVEPGQVIDVIVTGKVKWGSGNVYECNREETIDFNPWKDIENRLPKNALVRVKCIDREEKKFFGLIDGVPEINVFCYYPDQEKGIHVEEGKDYIGYVKKVNEATKLIQVAITDEVQTDKKAISSSGEGRTKEPDRNMNDKK